MPALGMTLSHMETIGIIVAAGKGIRMQAKIRKQYLILDGLPLLCHCLLAFDACPEIDRILMVIPEEDKEFCKQSILQPIALEHPVELIPGGKERQDSVYNALLAAEAKSSIVAIHDGVRPFVLPQHISETIRCAESTGAAVLAIPVTDTLKRVDGSHQVRETIDRKGVWIAQTPQSFRYDIIRDAHEKAKWEWALGTDDAHLVERAGYPVKLIRGSRFNIKITTPEDLSMAKALRSQMHPGVFQQSGKKP
ncbi:MAG: 2-C-methyl-D-erythritol 4-phosphate cytidylyltransferase [Desulfobacterales bacterium CG23_combo_of_CG06-09_8_20_14_all_52_9]|nr:MAG: 2-C-methyl-D-erythritol 4-phosphate cytidylyltransferase [Desulfobacterales bacterium CG23_combo_of_CG06-09_8_20_14_all_52_9]